MSLSAFLVAFGSFTGCGSTPSEQEPPTPPRAQASAVGGSARAERSGGAHTKASRKSSKAGRGSGGARRGSATEGARAKSSARGGEAPAPLGAMGEVSGTLKLDVTDPAKTIATLTLDSSAGSQPVAIGEIPGACKEIPSEPGEGAAPALWTVTCTGATGGGDFTVSQVTNTLVVRKAKRSPEGERGPFKLAKRVPLVEGAQVVRKG